MVCLKKNRTLLLTKEQGYSDRSWFLFDASSKILGRLSAEISKILQGAIWWWIMLTC